MKWWHRHVLFKRTGFHFFPHAHSRTIWQWWWGHLSSTAWAIHKGIKAFLLALQLWSANTALHRKGSNWLQMWEKPSRFFGRRKRSLNSRAPLKNTIWNHIACHQKTFGVKPLAQIPSETLSCDAFSVSLCIPADMWDTSSLYTLGLCSSAPLLALKVRIDI